MVLSPWCLHKWVQQECRAHSDPAASREWNCSVGANEKKGIEFFHFLNKNEKAFPLAQSKGGEVDGGNKAAN